MSEFREAQKEDHKCIYEFLYSSEEVEAVKWIRETLERVANNGGKNAMKAEVTRVLLDRLMNSMDNAHLAIHMAKERPDMLAQFEIDHAVEIAKEENSIVQGMN